MRGGEGTGIRFWTGTGNVFRPRSHFSLVWIVSKRVGDRLGDKRLGDDPEFGGDPTCVGRVPFRLLFHGSLVDSTMDKIRVPSTPSVPGLKSSGVTLPPSFLLSQVRSSCSEGRSDSLPTPACSWFTQPTPDVRVPVVLSLEDGVGPGMCPTTW